MCLFSFIEMGVSIIGVKAKYMHVKNCTRYQILLHISPLPPNAKVISFCTLIFSILLLLLSLGLSLDTIDFIFYGFSNFFNDEFLDYNYYFMKSSETSKKSQLCLKW